MSNHDITRRDIETWLRLRSTNSPMPEGLPDEAELALAAKHLIDTQPIVRLVPKPATTASPIASTAEGRVLSWCYQAAADALGWAREIKRGDASYPFPVEPDEALRAVRTLAAAHRDRQPA